VQTSVKRAAPVSEEWRASIARRIAAVHALWQRAVADLSVDHVNHFERAGVLPIAFTLMHYVVGEDRNVTRYLGADAMLWDQQGWAKRVGLVGDPPDRGTPMADAEVIRLGDMDAWRSYQTAVFARTERALATVPLGRFAQKALDRPPADRVKVPFIALLVPEGDFLVSDVCEAFLFQHAVRHLGELEHARALVGLGGLS
jgi:hypothetical protein